MELDGFKDLEQQRQAREDFFEKSFDPFYIEKGKRGGTGEIRQWKDGKYQKQSDGTWKPVKEGGGKDSSGDKPTGDTTEHNGKKYKKQANGKWLEVSEHGMTKKEHDKAWVDIGLNSSPSDFYSHHFQATRKKHQEAASKLSDKEHSDEEVGLGESLNEAARVGKSGDKLPVGSIHEHNGKKYKKQANGKWLGVSEYFNLSKKEHLDRKKKFDTEYDRNVDLGQGHTASDAAKFHGEAASKLSDKEYTDEEVGLSSKKEEPKKSEGGR